MHKGVFVGDNAKKRRRKILILCESHHPGDDPKNSEAGKEATYTTESVIRSDYYNSPHYRNYEVFNKIVKSFGYDPDLPGVREKFWEEVYFGNYIPVMCGVKSNDAKSILNDKENRKAYNDDLFKFVNKNGIDVIFCFSRLVYSKLPSLSADAQIFSVENMAAAECGTVGGKRDYISKCKYCADTEHNYVGVKLKKDLTVFGMRHPSARGGYAHSNYVDILRPEFGEI